MFAHPSLTDEQRDRYRRDAQDAFAVACNAISSARQRLEEAESGRPHSLTALGLFAAYDELLAQLSAADSAQAQG